MLYLICNTFEFYEENVYLIIFYFFIFIIINFFFFKLQYNLLKIHLKEIKIIKKKAFMTIRLFWFYIILFYLRFIMYKSLVGYIYLINRNTFNYRTIFNNILLNYFKYKINLNISNLYLNNYVYKIYKKIKKNVYNLNNNVVYFI